jgi:tetratricopeptide (TPR) repeat protein
MLAEAILRTGGLSDDDISASLPDIRQTLREGNALAVRLAASGYLSPSGAKVEPSDVNATTAIPVLANITGVEAGPLECAFQACWSGLPRQTRQLFFSLGALNGPWFRWGTATAIGNALRLARPDEQLGLLVESALLQVGCLYEGEERILRIHPSLRDLVRAGFAALSGEIRRTSYEAAASALITILRDSGDGPGVLELPHFPSIIEWAYRSKHNKLLISLCATLAPCWYDRWQFERGLVYLPWGLAAAQAVAGMNVPQDEILVAASLAHNYGLLLRHVGKHRAAGEVFRTELTLRQLTGDRSGEADTLLWIGNIALRQAELSEALEYYNQALAIYGDAGNRSGVGTALRYLGRIAQRQGYLDEAEDYYKSSLQIAEQTGNLPSQIWICSYLASIFQERGRLEMAEASYRQALHISRASGDWQGEGLVQSFLCDLALDRDQVDDAEKLGWESLHLSRLAADRPTGAYTLLSLARVAMRRKESRRARTLARESLTDMQEMCDRAGEVAALRVLATEE